MEAITWRLHSSAESPGLLVVKVSHSVPRDLIYYLFSIGYPHSSREAPARI